MSDLLVSIWAWPRTSRLATPLLLPAQWMGWEEVSGEGLGSPIPPLPSSKPMSRERPSACFPHQSCASQGEEAPGASQTQAALG